MKQSYKVGSVKQFIDISGLNEEDEVIRKQYSGDVQIKEDEERTVVAQISSMDVDAEGDMIDPEGCDFTRFMKNPVIHRNHSYKVEDVVGKAVQISSDKNGIVAKIQFADTPIALDCWKLVKGGYVKANSIGFITKKALVKGTDAFSQFVKEKGIKVKDECRRIIKEFELIESSVVSVPCNPEALMQAISAKSIELTEKTIKELDLPKVTEIKEEVKSKVEQKAEQVDLVIDEILKGETIEEVKPTPDYGFGFKTFEDFIKGTIEISKQEAE